jgi:hypothetical protein
MDTFNYELKQLCRHNRDGSFATQADRERLLDLMANQLKDLGYRHMHATSLKAKHVAALVNRWHTEAIAPGTFKNRMTALRWACEKTGKRSSSDRTMPTGFRRGFMSVTRRKPGCWTIPSLPQSAIRTQRCR